jgi:hypothetical protein
MSVSQIISIDVVDDLVLLLGDYYIDYKLWRKDVEDLFEELKLGESSLLLFDGELRRNVKSVFVGVTSPDGKLRLVEDRQVFHDGRKDVIRGVKGVFEKQEAGESSEEAAIRGLKQELFTGIEIDDSQLVLIPNDNLTDLVSVVTSAYEGLKTINDTTRYDVLLPQNLYLVEGYKEVQKKKTTYFVWEPIPE